MKLSERNQNLLITVAIAGGAFLLFVRPLLVKLGLAAGEGARAVNNLQRLPNNPFSPNYFLALKIKPSASLIAELEKKAKILWAAFGYFTDDEDAIFAVFKSLRSKAEVSLFSYYFTQYSHVDLLTFLQNGRDVLPENGLSDTEINNILAYVNRLPIK